MSQIINSTHGYDMLHLYGIIGKARLFEFSNFLVDIDVCLTLSRRTSIIPLFFVTIFGAESPHMYAYK